MTDQSNGQGQWRPDGSYDWGDGSGQPAQSADPWEQARRENEVYAQQRGSGGMLPFPHRTWRTRGGSQVTVGGCCLPLPLGCLATGLLGAVTLARAATRR